MINIGTIKPLNTSDAQLFVSFQTDTDNDTILVEVKDNDNNTLDTHKANFYERKTTIGINSAFIGLESPLPPDSSIQNANANIFYILEKSLYLCFLKTYDRQNNIEMSSMFSVIKGNESELPPNPNYAPVYVCHDVNQHTQKVTREQVNYINIVSTNTIRDVFPEAFIFLSNNTFVRFRNGPTLFTIQPQKMLSIPCGFNQSKLFPKMAPLPQNIYITGYQYAVSIFEEIFDDSGNFLRTEKRMLASRSFELAQRTHEGTEYLVFENGIGGIESQYFPIVKRGGTVEKATADKLFPAPPREGEKEEIIVSSHTTMTLQTEVLRVERLKILTKMFSNKVWRVGSKGFERVYVETKDFELPHNSKQFGVFEIKIKIKN